MCQPCKLTPEKEMCHVCLAVQNDDKHLCAGIRSVRECLGYLHDQVLISKDKALYLLETLMSHPFFRSAASKLSFLTGAVYHLSNHCLQMDYNYGAMVDYEGMIDQAVSDNSFMQKVKNFGQQNKPHSGDKGLKDEKQVHKKIPVLHTVFGCYGKGAKRKKTVVPESPEDTSLHQPQYPANKFSLLLLMANFGKHANDHRRKEKRAIWTAEDLISLLQHHFPGEIEECFSYFWQNLINTDWDQSHRQYVDHPVKGSRSSS